MKKIFLLITLFVSLLPSCQTDLKTYHGDNMIRFSDHAADVYTFAYFSDEKQIDTIKVDLMTIGEITDQPRTVHYEQVKQKWIYQYAQDDPNKIIDSTYADMPYPAEQGKHFEILNSDNGVLIIPSRSNSLTMRILIKRADKDLQKNARELYLRLLPGPDFTIPSQQVALKKITISDKLEKPRMWSDKDYFCNLYLGDWSEVKHRFMINITGQKWDDKFIKFYIRDSNDRPLRDFFLKKIKKALDAYNADPKNNPPLKDENGKPVVFP